jgi:hypothetical protein
MNKDEVIGLLENERSKNKHIRSPLYNSPEGIKRQLRQMIDYNFTQGLIYYYDDDSRKLRSMIIIVDEYR